MTPAPFSADISFIELLAHLVYGALIGNFLWLYPRLWRLVAKGGAQ